MNSTAALVAHYTAVRHRIFNPPKPAGTAAIIPYRQPPLWTRQWMYFDAHMIQWASWTAHQAFRNATPVNAYLLDRCEELGVDLKSLISHSREHRLVHPRQLLMWEVREKFGLSFPAIGRIFGGRDHTTCLHAWQKISRRFAAND